MASPHTRLRVVLVTLAVDVARLGAQLCASGSPSTQRLWGTPQAEGFRGGPEVPRPQGQLPPGFLHRAGPSRVMSP